MVVLLGAIRLQDLLPLHRTCSFILQRELMSLTDDPILFLSDCSPLREICFMFPLTCAGFVCFQLLCLRERGLMPLVGMCYIKLVVFFLEFLRRLGLLLHSFDILRML